MPNVEPTFGPNWDEDVGGFDTTNPYFFYLPRICNHCTHPACLEACPRKAIYKRQEDGIVLIDQERCRSYRYCIKACPYKKIYWNEVTQHSEKCIFCYPRLERGLVNACAAQCPGRIRFVGLLDDPESPVHKLVVLHKVALGLFPDKGTHPNVYYVPPFLPAKGGVAGKSLVEDPRLPIDYLKYLFGDGVVSVLQYLESELQRAQRGEKSDVLQLLIGRNESVRYRIVPHEVLQGTPEDVQKELNGAPPGPGLTPMGHADASGAAGLHLPIHGQAQAVAAAPSSDAAIPHAVRAAFGLGVIAAAASIAARPRVHIPIQGKDAPDPASAAAGCGSCGMSPGCAATGSAAFGPTPFDRLDAQAEGDPWY
jgi:Fe-S-cluster-containing dehydrogenase component